MNLAPDTYSALADVSVAFAPAPAAGLDDTGLVEAQRTLAEIRRRVDASAAVVAAEIRHRSRRELGYDGLAQRLGARTPELLVQQVTGFTGREAQTLVRVGSLMTPAAPVLPWLTAVATAVSAGRLSIEAADAIRAGLGAPSDDITADALAVAAATLLHEAPQLTVERLAARARELRSELDLDHVLDHEQRMRDRRFLQLVPQSDGMTRIHGLLDPESAAIIGTA